MKKTIILLSLLLVYGYCYPQTIVSGGIFSNTTWTQAGSPYIVTDTTVVFPGVTLTIEPGVTVKFDDAMYLEVRQGTIIANGNITDSITFTSNSLAPAPGIWGDNSASNGGIWLNNATISDFNFCNFLYATSGIGFATGQTYIKNSTFMHNETGIYYVSTTVDSCVFSYNSSGIMQVNIATFNYCNISNNYNGIEFGDNIILHNCMLDSNYRAVGGGNGVSASKFYDCSISYNQGDGVSTDHGGNLFYNCEINHNRIQGLYMGPPDGADSIINCRIKYNGIGINIMSTYDTLVITQCEIEYDTVGILVHDTEVKMYCNKICNNISYGLQLSNTDNFNASNNYWCTSDSVMISNAVYDGYDNVANGLITFLPIDTTCYLATGMHETENSTCRFEIFPNPATSVLNIMRHGWPANEKTALTIFDLYGRTVNYSTLTGERLTIDITTLSKGVYFIKAGNEMNKFIKE